MSTHQLRSFSNFSLTTIKAVKPPLARLTHYMSTPTNPGGGPIRARIILDPTFYKEADTEAKVAVEKAVAEEMLQMYSSGGRIAHKGPLSALPAESQGTVPKEHTFLWHVLNEHDLLCTVYVYAHAETPDQYGCLGKLMQVMADEIEEAEKGVRLGKGKVGGIAQAGSAIAFFEYLGGGLRSLEFIGA
ncbi:MAG: hypothetical protein Q9175_003409 [Cornicularia normoerica]